MFPTEEALHHYTAEVLEVIDGDTLRLAVDLGFHTSAVRNVRIRGVDAPEVYGEQASEAGRLARDWLSTLLHGMYVHITTYQVAGARDEWEADVYLPAYPGTQGIRPQPIDSLVDIAEALVQAGHAVRL